MTILRSTLRAILSLTVIFYIGCAGHTRLNYAEAQYHTTRAVLDALPIRSSSSMYRLGVDDLIEIKFFNNDQFNELVRVRPDGRISLAILDDIFVLGMTPMQLDSIITMAYSRIIQNPQITVFVREYGEQHIFLLGQIKSPGAYTITRNMTLLHAIAAAGGLSDGAEPRSIIVLRRRNRTTLAAYKVDISSLMKKGPHSRAKNPAVYAMDIVYVPKSYIASANVFLKQVYDVFLPPIDAYLRAMWYSEWVR